VEEIRIKTIQLNMGLLKMIIHLRFLLMKRSFRLRKRRKRGRMLKESRTRA
jgi:hypothetical protein